VCMRCCLWSTADCRCCCGLGATGLRSCGHIDIPLQWLLRSRYAVPAHFLMCNAIMTTCRGCSNSSVTMLLSQVCHHGAVLLTSQLRFASHSSIC
jgi:hypothetical protein